MRVKEEIIGVRFSTGRAQALGLIPDGEKKSRKKYSPGLAFAFIPAQRGGGKRMRKSWSCLATVSLRQIFKKKKNGHTRKDELNSLVALRSESANCGGLSLESQVLRRQEAVISPELRSSRPSLGNKSQLELECEE